MVKSIVSSLIALAILFAGAFYEQRYIKKTFREIHDRFDIVYEKLNDETIADGDVEYAYRFWLEKKKQLHMFIPHNEIKEFDLWIGESFVYVYDKNYEEAKAKMIVVLHLAEEIPKTFSIRLENIF